jgi:hypothetical protein
MSGINNTIRMATFIQQMEAGRSEPVAAMIIEAMYPYGKLPEGWPGANARKVAKLSRNVAKSINPKRQQSEAELLALLKETFSAYASFCPPQSTAQRVWLCFLAWTDDPSLKINDLLANAGLRFELK